MKYNIYINQKDIIEKDYPIDFIDAAILNVIHSLKTVDAIIDKSFKDEDGRYYWMSHNIILKEIPLLRTRGKNGMKPFTKEALRKRVDYLCKLGFLTKHKNNQALGRLYLKINDITNDMCRKNEGSDINTYPCDINTNPRYINTKGVGIQIPTPSDTDTYHNNTNNNNTNNNIDRGVKTPSKSIPYEAEFKEIFNILKTESGNDFRIDLSKIQKSNKYKDFVRFYKQHKKDYTFEEVKQVVSFMCKKNLGTPSQTYSNFTTLFRSKNFERNYDFWLTNKNKPISTPNTPTNTNIPERQESLTGDNLNRFKALSIKLNDRRFTQSVFFALFDGRKYEIIRNKYTTREIVNKILAGLDESTQAYNKNKSIVEIIRQEFKK